MRPRSVLSACEYRPAIAATNSSRAAMLIRLIPDPADEHRSGANQMRQWLSFQEHSRRGNASSHPDRRATNRTLTDKLALNILAHEGIEAIWRLHVAAAEACAAGCPSAATAVTE